MANKPNGRLQDQGFEHGGSKPLRGAFRDIEGAERAFCRLLASGLHDECISLEVVEDCPACAVERAGTTDPRADALIARVQGGGALGGGCMGLAMVGWPALPAHGAAGWVEGLAAVCVIGAWALSGAILGALAGAAVAELPIALANGRPPHRHYVLMVRPPAELEAKSLAVLSAAKARLGD